ncbi:unnamed protein product [Parajaminaea phylloscopi]
MAGEMCLGPEEERQLGSYEPDLLNFLSCLREGTGAQKCLSLQFEKVTHRSHDLSDITITAHLIGPPSTLLPDLRHRERIRFGFTGRLAQELYRFLEKYNETLPENTPIRGVLSGYGARQNRKGQGIWDHGGIRCMIWNFTSTNSSSESPPSPCPKGAQYSFTREWFLRDAQATADLPTQRSTSTSSSFTDVTSCSQRSSLPLSATAPSRSATPPSATDPFIKSESLSPGLPQTVEMGGPDTKENLVDSTGCAERLTPPPSSHAPHWFDTPASKQADSHTAQSPEHEAAPPPLAAPLLSHSIAVPANHQRHIELGHPDRLVTWAPNVEDAPETLAMIAEAEAQSDPQASAIQGIEKAGPPVPYHTKVSHTTPRSDQSDPATSTNRGSSKSGVSGPTSTLPITSLADCKLNNGPYKVVVVIHACQEPRHTSSAAGSYWQNVVLVDRTGLLRTMLFAAGLQAFDHLGEGAIILLERLEVQQWYGQGDLRQGLGNCGAWQVAGIAPKTPELTPDANIMPRFGALQPSDHEFERMRGMWQWYHVDGGAEETVRRQPKAWTRPLKKICDVRVSEKGEYFDLLAELLEFYPAQSSEQPARLYVTDYTRNGFTRAIFDQHLGYAEWEYNPRAGDEPGGGLVFSVALWAKQRLAIGGLRKGQLLLFSGLRSVSNGPKYGLSASVGGDRDLNLKVRDAHSHPEAAQLLARKAVWEKARAKELQRRRQIEEDNEAEWLEAHGREDLSTSDTNRLVPAADRISDANTEPTKEVSAEQSAAVPTTKRSPPPDQVMQNPMISETMGNSSRRSRTPDEEAALLKQNSQQAESEQALAIPTTALSHTRGVEADREAAPSVAVALQQNLDLPVPPPDEPSGPLGPTTMNYFPATTKATQLDPPISRSPSAPSAVSKPQTKANKRPRSSSEQPLPKGTDSDSRTRRRSLDPQLRSPLGLVPRTGPSVRDWVFATIESGQRLPAVPLEVFSTRTVDGWDWQRPYFGQLQHAVLLSVKPDEPQDWIKVVAGEHILSLAFLLAVPEGVESEWPLADKQCVHAVTSGKAACLFLGIEYTRLQDVAERGGVIKEVQAKLKALIRECGDDGDGERAVSAELDEDWTQPDRAALSRMPRHDWGLSMWRSRKSGQVLVSVYGCRIAPREPRHA